MDQTEAMAYLKKNKGGLTKQQYRTIKGQILSGNAEGAMRGIGKLLGKKGRGVDAAKT